MTAMRLPFTRSMPALFLSAPFPFRRATRAARSRIRSACFYPRPPRSRRATSFDHPEIYRWRLLSAPSPFEEGDGVSSLPGLAPGASIRALPVRGGRQHGGRDRLAGAASIRALPVRGGRRGRAGRERDRRGFYPRPPRSRRATRRACRPGRQAGFYPRPPRSRRATTGGAFPALDNCFYPRPPRSRRATSDG